MECYQYVVRFKVKKVFVSLLHDLFQYVTLDYYDNKCTKPLALWKRF